MSLPNEIVTTPTNVGSSFDAGAVVGFTASGAQAVNASGAAGVIMVARQGAPTGKRFSAVIVGEAKVRMVSGLTPSDGETVYVSDTAGLGTTSSPASSVPIGTIIDAATYSASNPFVTVLMGLQIVGAGGASVANWDPTLVRYFFVDNDNGDDSNIGYIDAAAGSTFTAAQSSAVAIKTLEQLRAIIPRNGASRSFVALIKPRSDAGNYLNKSGAQDYLDVGYGGYIYRAFKGSDLTNDANDRIDLGGVVGEAGPNADQSFTVNAYNGSTFELTVVAGPLGSSDTIAGLKVQWAGNVTAALRTIGNMAHFQNSATSMNLAADLTAPANGDEFFLMRPGVKVTDIRGNGYPPAAEAFSGTPTDIALLAGVECTGAFTHRELGRLQLTFVRTTGTTVFEGSDVVGRATYPLETGSLAIVGDSIDARGSFTVRKGNFAQIQVAAFHGATTRFQALNMVNVGEGCYSNSAPLFRLCGGAGAGMRPGVTFSTENTIGSMNPAPKPSFRCPAGLQIESTAANVGAVDLDGSTGSVEIIGQCNLNMRDFRGTTTANYVLDLTDAYKSVVVILSEGTGSAAADDMVLAGSAPAPFGGLAECNIVDQNGNDVQGTAGHVVDACKLVTNVGAPSIQQGIIVRGDGATNNGAQAASAAAASSAEVIGAAVHRIASGDPGYIASAGIVPVFMDAATPTPGAIAYLSPSVVGTGTVTVPPVAGANQKLRLGRVVGHNGSTLGRISWHPESLAVVADGNP